MGLYNLKWYYAPFKVIICAKLKVKVSVYFVTRMFSFILNIVSTKPKHKNENRKIDFDAFYLQEIKRVGAVFLYFDNFYAPLRRRGGILFC